MAIFFPKPLVFGFLQVVTVLLLVLLVCIFSTFTSVLYNNVRCSWSREDRLPVAISHCCNRCYYGISPLDGRGSYKTRVGKIQPAGQLWPTNWLYLVCGCPQSTLHAAEPCPLIHPGQPMPHSCPHLPHACRWHCPAPSPVQCAQLPGRAALHPLSCLQVAAHCTRQLSDWKMAWSWSPTHWSRNHLAAASPSPRWCLALPAA